MNKQVMAMLALVATTMSVHAQVKEVKRMSIKEASLSIGGGTENIGAFNQNEIKTVAPALSFVNKISDSKLTTYSSYYKSLSATNLTLNIGVQFKNKNGAAYKTNPIWRVGFSNLNNMNTSNTWGKNESFTIESFTSNNGQFIFVDSFNRKYLTAAFTSKEFRVENSINFRTNPSNRVSLYGGLGFGVGISYQSELLANYREYSYKIYSYTSSTSNAGTISELSENYKTENGKSAFAYLPIGAELKLSKRNDLLKRTSLFLEARPSFTYRKVANLDATMGNGIMQTAGLRVRW
jgi:hypothetical protein